MTASESAGDVMTRRQAAAVTSEHTLKIEAARAGVGVEEYQARFRQGLLWCYRCQDWHQAEAFPADARRHSGRKDRAARPLPAAARAVLAARGQHLGRRMAVWVIRRLGQGCSCCPAVSRGHTGAGPAAPYRGRTARGHGPRYSATTSPGSPAPAKRATR